MGLSRSLSIGASSLRSHQSKFDVISNNISNVNTYGFKSNRANFAEQFSQINNYGKAPDSVSGKGWGGTNPLQYGLGVRLASISTNMNQGSIETTQRPFDLALSGEGFFVYNYGGSQVYSRAGILSRDKEGNFVDSNTGAYVQGYNLKLDANGMIQKDSDGNNIINYAMTNLSIPQDIISPPKQTQNVRISGNLNSAAVDGTTRETSITIYDTLGNAHDLGFTFTKSATPNQYDVTGTVDGNALTLSASSVTFNADGSLNTPNDLTVTSADLNTALTSTTAFSSDLTVSLADASNLLSGITQFGGPSSATANDQDGYQQGSIINMNVDQSGKVWGAFTNGQSEVLGQLAVAKFENPEALSKQGNNFMVESPNSGNANVGTAIDTFPSTQVVSGSLEMSNVDLTEQFTDMIATQRGFEAASRIITVSDFILGEVNQLKR